MNYPHLLYAVAKAIEPSLGPEDYVSVHVRHGLGSMIIEVRYGEVGHEPAPLEIEARPPAPKVRGNHAKVPCPECAQEISLTNLSRHKQSRHGVPPPSPNEMRERRHQARREAAAEALFVQARPTD